MDVPNRRFDTVLMGLNTYRAVLDQGIGSPYAHLRQYVVSSSLDRIDDPAVELVRDPAALVRDLKREDGLDVWLCGGGGLAGSLLIEIDEMIIKSYPVVAGAGAALVDGGFRPTVFTPTDHRAFSNGAGITWYARRAGA
ncbi:dihydrofolate reductase family protein [Streptosporangium lutulentum]|uniref:Dihydrofolate reductase n=1 Tax=Streptosporangium lutulentum TaxID=1461250 RepID=A0ABT9QPJ8_9ACTN|nr:dihydrofolate reductase family protein [Streptosporangium lutulentum]MDP9847909.1 dihydrofolate reductase [Streptosporangium lutulentum]